MNNVFLFLSFIKTCFHLSLPPLTNRTSVVNVIVFCRFVSGNVIGAGVIGRRRENVLNRAKLFYRFCAIILGVTLNCQFSKSVNTFSFQFVDQKLISPKNDKFKIPSYLNRRLKIGTAYCVSTSRLQMVFVTYSCGSVSRSTVSSCGIS